MARSFSVTTESDLRRFMAALTSEAPDGCQVWRGSTDDAGYGRVGLSYVKKVGLPVSAHRLAYVLAGHPLAPGEVVMHLCDNPPCVNPAHLVAGTNLENRRDAQEKGMWFLAGIRGRDARAASPAQCAAILLRWDCDAVELRARAKRWRRNAAA